MKIEEELTLISAELKEEKRFAEATFHAKRLGNDLYELRRAPAGIPTLNYGDVVRAVRIEGRAHPLITELVKSSGHRAIRMFFLNKTSDHERQDVFTKLDELGVPYKMGPKDFYVLDVSPEKDYSAICEYLESQKENGLLKYETGNDVWKFMRACREEHPLRQYRT
jgi:hypothetical protein